MLKKYLVSYPVVFMAIILTIPTMLIYYKFEYWALNTFNEPTYLHIALTFVPSVFYSVVVMVYGIVFGGIAVTLTDWGKISCKNRSN